MAPRRRTTLRTGVRVTVLLKSIKPPPRQEDVGNVGPPIGDQTFVPDAY